MKKRSQKIVKGWLPKEGNQAIAMYLDRHSIRRGIAMSAVGMGISEAALWTAFLLGAYKDSGLFYSTQIVILGVYVVAIAVGVWLTKRAMGQTSRGWFPNEFAKTQQTPTEKFSPMIKWTARALVVGAVASAGLLVLGDVAGLTRGVSTYLWPIAVVGTVWRLVAAVPLIVKRKTNPQRPA